MIKQFLENNRIYFETLVPAALSLSAVLVSCAAYNVSTTQTEIAQVAVAPNFYVSESYLYDDVRKIAYETVLEIFNEGAFLTSYDETVRSFIELEFRVKQEQKKVYVPLIGYYGNFFKEIQTTGKITEARGDNNNEIYGELYSGISDYEFANKNGSVFVQLKHYIRLSYKNQLGQEGVEYFVGEERSTAEVVDNKLRQWAEEITHGEMYRLNEITVQNIEKIISEHRK